MSDRSGQNDTDNSFAGISFEGVNAVPPQSGENGDTINLADVADVSEQDDVSNAATETMPPLNFASDQTQPFQSFPTAGAAETTPAGTVPNGAVPTGAIPTGDMPSSTPAPAIPVLTMPVEGEAVVAKKRKLPLIITGIVLAVLVVAAIAGFFTARWYFQDKAAPGVTFGGTSVAGQTADQLKNTVTAAVKNTTVNIKDGNGNNASGSLSDLGVSYNVDKTVTELLAAKHQTNGALEYINEVNPFVKKNVPLNAKSNKLALRTFVTDKFVQDTDRAVPSTASYDANARAFVAVEGRGGRSPKVDNVIDAVAKAIANPGHSGSVTITYETIDVPVALPEAQNVADQANARLNAPIVLDNGQGKTFQIPAEVVASWLKTDADLEHGTLSLSYDDNAITNYVQQQVPAQLNQDAVEPGRRRRQQRQSAGHHRQRRERREGQEHGGARTEDRRSAQTAKAPPFRWTVMCRTPKPCRRRANTASWWTAPRKLPPCIITTRPSRPSRCARAPPASTKPTWAPSTYLSIRSRT